MSTISIANNRNTLTAISGGESKELAHLLERMKRNVSTASQLNWPAVLMAPTWLTLLLLLILSLTLAGGSSAAEIAAATASNSAASAGGAAAASSAAAAAAATIAATSTGSNPPLHPDLARTTNWRQQQQVASSMRAELDEILDQLVRLEAEPSRSLDECAHWYQLNLRYKELEASGAVGAHLQRQGARLKEADCDQLEQLVAETRDRMANFRHLLRRERGEFDYVGELASEFLELSYAASANEQLAREFNELRAGSRVEGQLVGQAGKLEQLEQLMDFIRSNSDGHHEDEFPVAAAMAQASVPSHQVLLPPTNGHYLDELSELDSVLRVLIERERLLTSQELGHMAEMSGILERRLNDGLVDLGSGRFRLLTGTLDAVRTILMHRAADEEEMAAQLDFEAQQRAAWDVRDRLAQVPRFHRPQAPLMAASSAASTSAAASGGASMASSTAATSAGLNGRGHEGQFSIMTPSVSAAAAAANTMMPPNHHRILGNSIMETNGHVPYQPDRSHLANVRIHQRRFAD